MICFKGKYNRESREGIYGKMRNKSENPFTGGETGPALEVQSTCEAGTALRDPETGFFRFHPGMTGEHVFGQQIYDIK